MSVVPAIGLRPERPVERASARPHDETGFARALARKEEDARGETARGTSRSDETAASTVAGAREGEARDEERPDAPAEGVQSKSEAPREGDAGDGSVQNGASGEIGDANSAAAGPTPTRLQPQDAAAAFAALVARIAQDHAARGASPAAATTGEPPPSPLPVRSGAAPGEAPSSQQAGAWARRDVKLGAFEAAGEAAAPPREGAFPLGAVAIGSISSERHLAPAAALDAAALSPASTVADPIERPVAAPAHSMRLTLSPQGLGEIDVTLRLRAGRLDAVVAAERPEAAAAVETRRADLADALRRAGYEVDGAGLSIETRRADPGAASNPSGDSPSRSREDASERERGAADPRGGGREPRGGEESARRRSRSSSTPSFELDA
jgi:hypothetical protein